MCPDDSQFFSGNSTGAFLGCCTIDPATTSDGLCPNECLRPTTFNSAVYGSIPKQACAGPDVGAQWFVCAYTKPPFMGCCVADACKKGCAPTELRPAKLSSIVEDANVFIDGPSSFSTSTASSRSASSTPTASPSSTASAAATSNSAHQGMQPGTVAGLAVSTAASVSATALLIFWLLRRRRAPASATHDYALPGSAPDSQCQTPAASAWTFDDRSAAYAGHLSYASLHQGGADGGRHSIPPEYSAVAKHSSAPSELPGSVTTTVFELHEETSPPLRSDGFAPR
ncbi:hypothetical protein BBO_05406 [Beauveria brongniartii RCEF 3172]|uniref:Uncharacterized protein n=1 Tax=Beauveria brongniartii RCEF 3172 TaxID=1081107 RepID=A0A167CPE1_9HYPO|nr:hypothetical protein BBO_05406 [Beauveria brongniartii RCEF 3172]